jgi:tetratricopeptide (TPR) repeat protein
VGLFDKMKLAVGIGGAKVEIKMEPGAVALGGFAKGQVILRGGKAEQKCNALMLVLKRNEVVKVRDDQGNSRSETRTEKLSEENLAAYEQTIRPESESTFEFTVQIPNEEGPNLSYEIYATADVPGAIDPSATVKLATTKAAPATAASVPTMISTAKRLYDNGSDKYAEVEGLLKQVIGFEPKNADALLMLAKVVDYRNNAQAAPYFKTYLEVVPEDAKAWADFARSAEYRSSYDEALGYNQRALALAPQSSEYWAARADVMEKLKRFDEAAACCDKALAGDSAQSWYQIKKAKLLVAGGRIDLAGQAFMDAGAKGDTYVLLDVLQGLDACGMGGHEELIQRAISANPGDPQTFWVKAEWLLSKNDAAGAIAVLDGATSKAWESEWSRSNLWCLKGRAMEAVQDRAGAKLSYQRAITEYKDNSEAARRLKELK